MQLFDPHEDAPYILIYAKCMIIHVKPAEGWLGSTVYTSISWIQLTALVSATLFGKILQAFRPLD